MTAMGPFSLSQLGNPIPDNPVSDNRQPDTGLSDTPAPPPAPVQDSPIPVPDNPIPDKPQPDTGVSDTGVSDNRLPSTGVTDTGMTEDERRQIQTALERIGQIPDPAQRVHAATDAIAVLERYTKLARKIRHITIREMLRSGMGPQPVANATGLSVSTVKVIKQSLTDEGE